MNEDNEQVKDKITYLYHAFLILMAFVKNDRNGDGESSIIFLAVSGIYLMYWIIKNRKGYMPWRIYIDFWVGTVIQVILNLVIGYTNEHSWGPFLYVFMLILYALLIGIVNWILWSIDKIRKK